MRQGQYQNYRGQRGDRSNPRHGQQQTPVQMSAFQLLVNKEIPPELLGETALKLTKEIMQSDQDRNSSSQVRRYYGEIKTLQRRVEMGEKWERILPLVKMMKARAGYNLHRKVIGNAFKTFIDRGIDQVHTKEEFASFCLLFEAVLGHLYGEGGLKKDE